MPVHNQFLLVNGGLNAQALAARGPILQVEIHLPTLLALHYQNAGTPLPQPTVGLAMVDTGASKTCVDDTVIVAMAATRGIRRQLGICTETVQKHVSHALSKTGSKTRAGLVSSLKSELQSEREHGLRRAS